MNKTPDWALKASQRYDHNKVDRIAFRVPKGIKEKLQKAAKENNESVNQLLNRLVEEELKKHSL